MDHVYERKIFTYKMNNKHSEGTEPRIEMTLFILSRELGTALHKKGDYSFDQL